MKRIALPILFLLAWACVGTQAREHALMPALRASLPHITAAIERGAAGDPATLGRAADLKTAVETGAVQGFLWSPLEAPAQAGIRARAAASEIGPGVAESLIEEVRQFGVGMRKAGAL